MPAVAWHDYSNSLGSFSDVNKNDATGELGRINFTFPDNFALEARRGYYASVSHVDHQLGRVLRELERLGMAGDTIVSFIGEKKNAFAFKKRITTESRMRLFFVSDSSRRPRIPPWRAVRVGEEHQLRGRPPLSHDDQDPGSDHGRIPADKQVH